MLPMFCPKCGKSNDDQAKFCSDCAYSLQSLSAPLAGTSAVTEEKRKVGVLLGVGIVFFPYVFAWFTLRKGYSTVARAVSLGWLGLLLVIATSGGRGKSQSTSTVAATNPQQLSQTAPNEPAATAPRFIDESCDELSRAFGPGSKMSDLQKEELWKSYKGRYFNWQLKVTEVSSDMFGGFTVQYKCGRNSPSLIQDVQVKYKDSAKDVVMGFEKGSVYEVKGVLDMQSTLLGMTADALP